MVYWVGHYNQFNTKNRVYRVKIFKKTKKKKKSLLGFRIRPFKHLFWWSTVWFGRWNSFTLSLHEGFPPPPSSSGVTRSGSILPCPPPPPLSAMLQGLVMMSCVVLFWFGLVWSMCMCNKLPYSLLVIRRHGSAKNSSTKTRGNVRISLWSHLSIWITRK